MKKIETTLVRAHAAVREFYDVNRHHFIAMNAIDLGDKLEVQWFFADYEPPGEVTAFVTFAAYDDIIPSLCDVVTSAWVAEAEFFDLFGVKVEGHEKGFVLEKDSPETPLRRSAK